MSAHSLKDTSMGLVVDTSVCSKCSCQLRRQSTAPPWNAEHRLEGHLLQHRSQVRGHLVYTPSYTCRKAPSARKVLATPAQVRPQRRLHFGDCAISCTREALHPYRYCVCKSCPSFSVTVFVQLPRSIIIFTLVHIALLPEAGVLVAAPLPLLGGHSVDPCMDASQIG